MDFTFKSFENLSNLELYQLLKLRTDVFVVEQNCPYPEMDNKDLKAIHVFLQEEDEVIAIARILPKNISYAEWSFGRIATHANHRKEGLGIKLMTALMDYMKMHHSQELIRISAQSHLEKFYSSFGFVHTGKSYDEDGIPHIEMLYRPE